MSGPERPLGKSGVSVPALGVGTNRWNTGEPGQARLNETLAVAVEVGMGFFDTAEIYRFGRSERAVGLATRQVGQPVVVASKFAPMPAWITGAQFDSALDRTLKRLGRESIDLYYLHFPTPRAGWAPG
jgi:aryl-alcohol dehydrogenase-like predicted oxidoreductase